MLLKDDQEFYIHHGDCIPHMAEMPDHSVDFSIYSPPFPSLYAYTSEYGDIGNTDTVGDEARLHLSFFYKRIARILKPGRVMMVHVCQIPRMKRSGEVGMCDFRGLNIRIGERAGLIYEYDWLVRKNPQSQALRTRSRELQFAGLETDRAKSRGAIPDYLIKFRAPGENAVPIRDWMEEVDDDGDTTGKKVKLHDQQVSRNDWIKYAESSWVDIRETDTLNVKAAKGEEDTKHICPLQLSVIDRLVRLYSNPGELVFSPFAGIGSELYTALKLGRRAYGCELKGEYFREANKNCLSVVNNRRKTTSLFGDDDGSGDFMEFTSADSEFDPKVGV